VVIYLTILGIILCYVYFIMSLRPKKDVEDFLSGSPSSTVLLTGGLGFIGSHVVEELQSRGFQVIVLDDESNGHNFMPSPVNVLGDISVETDLNRIRSNVTYIIHLAAAISVAESMTNKEKYHRINIEGSRKVLDWALAHGVHRVVAASSAAVYGNPPNPPISEDFGYDGVSPYAESKYEMEKVMEEYSRSFKLHGVALRFFNVFGPRQDPHSQYSGVISLFMEKARTNEPLKIFGDGEQTRDFVYVKDVARAIVTSMDAEHSTPDGSPTMKGFHVYNVCTGKETTVNELANLVIRQFQSTSAVLHNEPRPGDIKKSVCNPTKAKEELGFVAGFSVSDGLQATKHWFLEASRKNG